MSQSDQLAELKERLAKVEKDISEAACWGAYVAALGEEQRSLMREIAYVEMKLHNDPATR